MKWSRGIVLCLAVSACDATDDALYRSVPSDVGPVLQRVAPLSDVERLSLERVWEVGPESWADPTKVSIDDERVAVVDPQSLRVHLFDAASGAPLSVFGRRGEGPGEWRRVSDAVLVGGRVAVSRSAVEGLVLHDLTGAEEGTLDFGIRSPEVLGGPGERVLATSMMRPSIALVGDDIAEFELPASTYPESEFGPCSEFAPSLEGFVRLRCTAGRMEFHDATGALVRRTEWPQDPEEASSRQLDDFIDRFWDAQRGDRERGPLVDRQLDALAERSRIMPRFSHIRSNRLDGSFLVVEQPFDGYGGVPATLHRLDTEGRHLGIAETDLLVRDAAMHGDRVALLIVDPATGLVSLVVARLT